MSTLPQEQSDAADACQNAAVLAAAPNKLPFDEAKVVRMFAAEAAEIGLSPPSDIVLCELCRQVAAISSELFSSDITVDVRRDPEIPMELHFTFNVVATGSADEIVEQSNAWHRKVRQTIGSDAELFCLSLNVR